MMDEVISAGGIVYRERSFLMLKKKNGDWVLPKGRIEENETIEETAIREVKEETNIDVVIEDYIGSTSFSFSNYWTKYVVTNKKVSWYLMRAISFAIKPLADEGFIDARFIDIDDVVDLARYDDEKKVIRNALIALRFIEK